MRSSPPDNEARPHWHPSGTLSVFESGSVIIEGEAPYHAGEVRFVKADFAYGVEVGGPDGCTFFFMSLGPHGRFDPDDHPAPGRSWDETQPTP